MKKIVFLVFALFSLAANAQFSIRSGFGYTWNARSTSYLDIVDAAQNTTYVLKFSRLAQGLNVFIMPKYHFAEKVAFNKRGRQVSGQKNSDFGIGAPTILGFGGIFNSGQGTQVNFLYSLGATADYNFGSFSYNARNNNFGAFIGAGFGIQNTSNMQVTNSTDVTGIVAPSSSHFQTTVDKSNSYSPNALGVGPILHAAIEFQNPFRGNGSKTGLRFGFQPAINKQGLSYYTICLLSGLNGSVGTNTGLNWF